MDIACNIDNRYVKYCVVMLVSLFENNKKGIFDVHIISESLSDDNKKMMNDILQRYQNRLHFYDVGSEILRNCPISPDSYISISTYYRVFLPVILPESVSKVLYLDCDLIVLTSIDDLWNIDMTNYAVAAVEDMWSEPKEPYERLGYSYEYSYFNAGVMLINLDYWRLHNILDQCLEYIQKYPERLVLYDQDVLNVVLYDKKLFIPFIWNMQEGFYRRKRRIRKETWEELDSLLATPSILHYIGEIKPWHKNSLHPLTEEWYIYLDKTPWKGERPEVDIWKPIKKIIQPIAYFLKIDKPKYRKVHKMVKK